MSDLLSARVLSRQKISRTTVSVCDGPRDIKAFLEVSSARGNVLVSPPIFGASVPIQL